MTQHIYQRSSGFSIGRDQLKLLKGQFVYVLEVCAKRKRAGEDVSEVLPILTEYSRLLFAKRPGWLTLIDDRILVDVTNQLDLMSTWETAIRDPSELNQLESAIEGAFGKLAAQLREMVAKVINIYCLLQAVILKRSIGGGRRISHAQECV